MDFKELYKTDFQLTNLFAMHQKWDNGAVFSIGRHRKTAAFLYLKNCCAEYSLAGGNSFTAQAGAVVYLPQGSTYKSRFISQNDTCLTELVEFSIVDNSGHLLLSGNQPCILQAEASPFIAGLFSRAADIYSGSVIRFAELRSILYSLISECSLKHYKRDILSRQFAPIAPAILYLEQTPCPALSIAALSEMCHITPAYFRRLFHQYAGVSPVTYRNNSRIEYAKKLLENGAYSIVEIAAAAGFADVAYFCRAFKRASGYRPGEYMTAKASAPPQ